jgi:hypothetical protein
MKASLNRRKKFIICNPNIFFWGMKYLLHSVVQATFGGLAGDG